MKLTALTAEQVAQDNDQDYVVLEDLIRNQVAVATAPNAPPLFTTDVDPYALMAAYLENLPAKKRQHYTCHCCRKFIQKYGGLVFINSDGSTEPVFFCQRNEQGIPLFSSSRMKMTKLIEKARVTGVFESSENIWGTPQTGPWTHLSGRNGHIFCDRVKTVDQYMAEKKEEHHMLCRALADYSIEVVERTVAILEADALDRSEKTLGVAKWFLKLHDSINELKSFAGSARQRDNLIWAAVAKAPPGWCHIRTTMINTLLDDIAAGMDLNEVKRRWAAKMHPLKYQRPTTPPNEGAIKRAEELVAKLGVAASLNRRFAKLSDVTAWLWKPPIRNVMPKIGGISFRCDCGCNVFESLGDYKYRCNSCRMTYTGEPESPKGGGVFDHLRKDKGGKLPELELPSKTMTWEKFAEKVLPTALEIEFYVPNGMQNFYGLVTTVDPNAPPILQWDTTEQRNPVSQYVYVNGSYASSWNLSIGAWVKLNGIFASPAHWHTPEKFAHHTPGAYFALEGARDVAHTKGGGLFPETLKKEYHEIRSVIEAHAKQASIAGKDEPDQANGYAISKGASFTNIRLRVKTTKGLENYIIDRWE